MTTATPFRNTDDDPQAARYWADLETSMMAHTIASCARLSPQRQNALLQRWVYGSFNASAYGVGIGLSGLGTLQWSEQPTGQYRLLYHSAYGLACSMAQVYRQPDGSWAALVIAGVRDGCEDAMSAAEWAISRLTA